MEDEKTPNEVIVMKQFYDLFDKNGIDEITLRCNVNKVLSEESNEPLYKETVWHCEAMMDIDGDKVFISTGAYGMFHAIERFTQKVEALEKGGEK